MRYALLVQLSNDDLEAQADPARSEQHIAAYTAYARALASAGVLVGGAGLQTPELATTLRIREGKRVVQDGPFAASKEQLAGFFLLEVPDLDAALSWAARCPAAATGAVEIRPLVPEP